jgi:hypothetical protein
MKCALVAKVSAHECFGKLGNRRAECANSDSRMERWDGVIHQAGERVTNVMYKSLSSLKVGFLISSPSGRAWQEQITETSLFRNLVMRACFLTMSLVPD